MMRFLEDKLVFGRTFRDQKLFSIFFYYSCDNHHLITWLQDLRAPKQFLQINPVLLSSARVSISQAE